MSVYFILMPIIFIVGILAIAFEDKLKVNKGATALTMCVAMWSLLLFANTGGTRSKDFSEYVESHKELQEMSLTEQAQEYVGNALTFHLGDVSGTLFFIVCTMLIVDTVDKYGGFKSITYYVNTSNKRKLLWRIVLISFFFSALLDNLAAAVVIIAIIRKLVPDRTDRLKYACISIIACNAGGSWSPIGDVTTLLLWTNGRLTPDYQILRIFVPAFVNMFIPTLIAHFWLFKKNAKLRVSPLDDKNDELSEAIPNRSRRTIFYIGMFSLVMTPFYQIFLKIPAFMGAIIGVVIVWVYTELIFKKQKNLIKKANSLRLANLMHGSDLSTIFYFLGILMSVAAMETSGHLYMASTYISGVLPNSNILAFVIGVLSSMLDNVALVAGVLGMYPTEAIIGSPFAINGDFWTFLSYCAVTGGSLLIIGSATGVTIMGLENIDFKYYFKRFSVLALAGYVAGAGMQLLILNI